jgi:hypothetical protein
VGHRVHGHLPLLHALQEGRLGLGARAVDLVAQHDVREDRAGLELEVAVLLVEHVDTGDVGGEQVRGELDPPEGAVDRARDRLSQHRLAHTGHVLDQQVSLRDQGDERQADLRVLAAHDPFDVGLDLPEPRGERSRVLGPLLKLFHDHLRRVVVNPTAAATNGGPGAQP